MTIRVSNQYLDASVTRDIQASFKELTRLQQQVSTQKLFQKASENPISANQAIMLGRNLAEVAQYQKNVAQGSELLTYSDNMAGQIRALMGEAAAKVAQGLNATAEPEGLQAIAGELQSSLDQILSLANSSLAGRAVFGGQRYTTTPFENLGDQVLFRGDTKTVDVNIFGRESMAASLDPEGLFGALATSISSERDLDSRVTPMTLSTAVPAGTLVLTEGRDLETASLSVTVQAGDTIDTVVGRINTAARAKAATAAADAAAAAVKAYEESIGDTVDGSITIGATTLTAASFQAAYTTANSAAVKTATRTLLTNTYTTEAQPVTAAVENAIAAAERAGRNAYAAGEFSAALSRGGLQVLHRTGRVLGVDEATSGASLLADLELAGADTARTFQYQGVITGSVATDQTISFAGVDGGTLSVQVRAGDTLSVIARRINQAVNGSGVSAAFRQLVASVSSDTADGVSKLKIVNDRGFSVNGVTELTSGTATTQASLAARRNRVEDLRSGAGLALGTAALEGTTVTGWGSTVTVRAGDSLDHVLRQLDGLAGFEAAINAAGTGIDLRSVARYSVAATPVAPLVVTLAADGSSASATVDLTGLGTMSERAEAINAKSSSTFRFHAEVDAAGTGLVISSNVKFTMSDTGDASMTKTLSNLSDLSANTLTPGTLLDGLGLAGTMGTTGLVSGRSILGRQVRLADLNAGAGVSLGRIRIAIGSSSADIDLSTAVTLRDVKDLIEAALPGQVRLDVNAAENGLSLVSLSGITMTLEELDGGATARHLGLIKVPDSSASGSTITGADLDPRTTAQTRLKDLRGRAGVDLRGFTLTSNGQSTTVSLDNDGDGVDDVRTLQQLAERVNQRSRQDHLHLDAEVDGRGRLKVSSQLSGSSLQAGELASDRRYFKVGGIAADPLAAQTLQIQGPSGSTAVSVTLAAGASLSAVVDAINGAALRASFAFNARIDTDGTSVMIESPAAASIAVSNTTTPATTYTHAWIAPHAGSGPDFGSAASDLGLLGSFSDTTALSTLNSGGGITNGQFNLSWGSKLATGYTVEGLKVPVTNNQTLTVYNENASKSFTVTLATTDDLSTIAGNINTAAAAAGFASVWATAYPGDSMVRLVSTGKRVSATQKDTVTNVTTSLVTLVGNAGALDPSRTTTVTVDLEAATTLGDVKRAIETATRNAVRVDYGQGGRLQLRLASNDMAQAIRVQETSDSSDTASSLGLLPFADLVGRDLGDGGARTLTGATLLSDLGLAFNASAATNSKENTLVLLDGDAPVTIDLASARTVGDVVSAINAKTLSDTGASVNFDARIVDGRYLAVANRSGLPVRALVSDFSRAAEKLGLVPDPARTANAFLAGSALAPRNRADNFFSALSTVISSYRAGQANQPEVSKALAMMERAESTYLAARAEAGGRLSRFEVLKTRFEEETTFLDDALGKRTDADIIEATTRYTTQQQVYQAGLASAGRILGLSLFNYL